MKSKLAKLLVSKGFKGAEIFSLGIPDQLLLLPLVAAYEETLGE